ncbi:uncharacterized protein LOC119310919 isoform X2 [Triticum dicoccoides]|uniref:uncharacterized protein LOC119310919 isoform X2 n=1 Tax=Triticum dicoccoides TaxID=85692 RepID=UPI000E79A244|nr:uncharacterized protein LOC119310919 isoform X2 [Triticum dicoccoides]
MLNRVMSMQRESCRLQIQPHNGPADSTVHRKDSTCTEDHCSQGGEPQCPGPHLPEDIWCHIFSLLPMQDAARTACVSHAFKRSWRCYPNLAFNAKALGMDERSCGEDEILKYLEVLHCSSLKVIEIEAPNLSNFQFMGLCQVQLSLGVALQFKKFDMSFPGVVSYACTNLLSNLQYVEALSLCSRHEIIDTPVLPSKFLHLKHLSVDLNAMTFPPTYDYCSLISLFDASPSLETLVLNVLQRKMLHESIVGDTSNLRQIPGHRHDRLKTVKIIGFSSAKSVVELTCHIIENTASLQCLTLDTTTGHPWHSCLTNYSGKCLHLRVDFLVEVGKGLLAIKTYVEPKVPSRVKLNVVEPCRRCHDLEPLS